MLGLILMVLGLGGLIYSHRRWRSEGEDQKNRSLIDRSTTAICIAVSHLVFWTGTLRWVGLPTDEVTGKAVLTIIFMLVSAAINLWIISPHERPRKSRRLTTYE